MRLLSKRFLEFPILSVLLVATTAIAQTANTASSSPVAQTLDFPNVLYGAAYYNEYTPQDTPTAQAERLEKDVALMKAAGISVVRMGEST